MLQINAKIGPLLSVAMNRVERFVLILNKELTVHLSAVALYGLMSAILNWQDSLIGCGAL
jgi:hypothetical protein